MPKISRRDFLKYSSLLTGTAALSGLAPQVARADFSRSAASPSILIFVFDAMSAKNLSLYGYKRKTTPNFERFAQHATVYNTHYSAASFTTPGTASLVTGLYPWTHRAINESGLIARDIASQNLFRAIGGRYQRLAFSQNLWPNYFFGQFRADIEKILPPASFSVIEEIVGDKLGPDLATGHRTFEDFLFQDGTPPASLFFGLAERILMRRAVVHTQDSEYPNGLPRTGNYPIFFKMKDVFDGLITTVDQLGPSSLAYLHLWSPHAPYVSTTRFADFFTDQWRPVEKPEHVLGDHIPPSEVNNRRRSYDNYIANLDDEFGRLLDFLTAKGLFDQSYIVVTSDHGEFFERGEEGHISSMLYDPVVRVPLMISSPGQTTRKDVDSPTVSVDLVPTLARLAGSELPAWSEGTLLPGLGGGETAGRSIFMMDAKNNPAFGPLSLASFAIRKDQYKLIYYKGYEQYGGEAAFELYNMDADPEELDDLYPGNPSVAKPLQAELLAKIDSVNAQSTH